jgi:hypothetical protein
MRTIGHGLSLPPPLRRTNARVEDPTAVVNITEVARREAPDFSVIIHANFDAELIGRHLNVDGILC